MIAEQGTATAVNPQEVFELLGRAVQDHLDLSGAVDEEKVREIANEEVAKARVPHDLIVRDSAGEEIGKVEGRTHCQFAELLRLVTEEGCNNVMLVGPAGTGKTTLAEHVAKALGRDFGFLSLSAGVTETHFFGRMLPQADGSWQHMLSKFLELYEKPGVFLLDEIDAADPNVMVAVNSALANGKLTDPYGVVRYRHAQNVVIAAANTWGLGGDAMYVGRNQLDAATLDRFVLSIIYVCYDEELEKDIAACLPTDQGTELLEWVRGLRDSITTNRLRRVASTRLVLRATVAMQSKQTLDQVKERYFKSWSRDEKAKVGQ